MRPVAAAALTLLAACGSITDPTLPAASAAKRPRPTRPAILFVHGYNSSASIWTTMIDRFKRDGWQSSQLASFTYNSSASNATTAGIIAGKVQDLLDATGSTQVVIVGHSMGTLSARYYVRTLDGQANVSAVVSLAGANHGTNIAIFCQSAVSCQEMVPGSSFLTALNSTDETWGTPRYATWWSPCDEVISPRESMLLAGAINTQTACLKHSQMYQDSKVYTQVKDFVSQPAPNAFIASAR